MSMKTVLNEKLKTIAANMAAIESKSDKGEAKPEDLEAYKSYVAEGKQIREQLTTVEDAEALKSWMKGPDGDSAARKAFSQEVTSPDDRVQEQKAQDEATKSAYNGAFEGYLMRGSKISSNDKSILDKGAIKAKDPMAMKVLTEAVAQGGGYLVPEQ